MYSLEDSYESFLPEKIHTKFCKFLIGVNKYSCNLACRGETGRLPLAISGILLSLKYWLHINDPNICNFDKRFTYQSLSSDSNEETSSYNEQIKCFLELSGFEHVWLNKCTFSTKKFINAVKNKLTDRYNDYFMKAISGEITVNNGRKLEKLRMFKNFKSSYKSEKYLNLNLEKHIIFNFSKLRISNHRLEIERGRYKDLPADKRFCKICNDNVSVEDEFHFVMMCNAYCDLRYKLFKEINSFVVNFDKLTTWDQFLFLMCSEDTEILSLFLVFIDSCLNIRQSSGKSDIISIVE